VTLWTGVVVHARLCTLNMNPLYLSKTVMLVGLLCSRFWRFK